MTLVYTIICLFSLGLFFAVVLYFVASKFKVEEDPRIDQVEALLPGANCGGCGSAGCRAFAEKAVKSGDLEENFCPVGGNKTMSRIASILGCSVEAQDPKVAVIRCRGSIECRPRTKSYDGDYSCRIAAALSMGDTDCQWGCLGYGDCVEVCTMHCISLNFKTGLPEVNTDICGGCGSCVKSCPHSVIELRPKGRMVYVSCVNREKGVTVRRACSVGCIACGKCERNCERQAIKVENNVAYIDFTKCNLCRKCETDCPTNSIFSTNFAASFVESYSKDLKDIKAKEGE